MGTHLICLRGCWRKMLAERQEVVSGRRRGKESGREGKEEEWEGRVGRDCETKEGMGW